jgi:hypothetical protein
MPDPDPNVPPAIVPPTTPPAADPPAPDPKAGQGGNDEAKFRRLFEAEQAKSRASEQRLAELDAAETKRRESEMTELQKVQARAEEAEKRATKMEHENLRRQVAAEAQLTPEALEFLQGEDEAALRASAAKLATLVTKAPVQLGSHTQPGGSQKPTVEDQIAAAQKAGNWQESMRLKREAAGFGVKPAQ